MTDLHVQENVISRGNFSCQIPNLILRPNIYQLIGENGAGKSVFLTSLAGVELPHIIENKDINVLYLSEVPIVYPFLTIEDNINLLHHFHQLTPDKEFIQKLYRGEQLATLASDASLGMQLKVGCTLLFQYQYWDLVILDETLSGIDKSSLTIIRESFQKLVDLNTIVIFVSHSDIFQDIEGSRLYIEQERLYESLER